MLMVAPHIPGQEGSKPVLLGFGCTVRGGALSCEALFVGAHIPAQVLTVELHERHRAPRVLRLEWTPLAERLWKDATITISKETP